MSRVPTKSAAPVSNTTTKGSIRVGRGRSAETVNERVPRSRTVETPAPTAASVKATSTASFRTKRPADSKLNMPVSIAAAKRSRRRAMATAVINKKTNRRSEKRRKKETRREMSRGARETRETAKKARKTTKQKENEDKTG